MGATHHARVQIGLAIILSAKCRVGKTKCAHRTVQRGHAIALPTLLLLAEHLGLRAEGELLKLIEAAGLSVKGKLDARPTHPKTQDETDPLHVARSREVTTLWRLVAAT